MNRSNWTKSETALMLTVVLGVASIVGISRWLDSRQLTRSITEDEKLYLDPSTAKRLSLGFNGLAADWYWMRSLQYVGNKIINLPPEAHLDSLAQLNLELLVPLLDTATTLDPHFMAPYEYAATVLPELDEEEAIRIIRKGIDANPTEWRLYHSLGYISWQQKDYSAASDAYGRGASLPGAPAWMAVMKARMLNEGGSRNTAREIYARMYDEAADDFVKDMARRHLMHLDSLDERDALRRLLTTYKSRTGRCPETWQEIAPVLRALKVRIDQSNTPLDPSGAPYVLAAGQCEVALDPKSEVPK